MQAVLGAERSVWVATANLKDVMVEDPRVVPGRRRGRRSNYRSVLEMLAELAQRGVELRILHASAPSRAFRRSFDAQRELVAGGIEMRVCPRVHLKTVVVDARLVYLGSANWTGAGLGAKGDGRRNFEMGRSRNATTASGAVQNAPTVDCGMSAKCRSMRSRSTPTPRKADALRRSRGFADTAAGPCAQIPWPHEQSLEVAHEQRMCCRSWSRDRHGG
jgi:hypothetical protein